MGWSKEVAEALAVIERAYGSFVLVARAGDATGVLVHAYAPTTALVADVERWLRAYRGTPPPLARVERPWDGRRVPRDEQGVEVQAIPCPVPGCPEKRHPLYRFEPGVRVISKIARCNRGDLKHIPAGSRGAVLSWTQYSQPLSIRVEFDDVMDYDDEPHRKRARESFYPCELEVDPDPKGEPKDEP